MSNTIKLQSSSGTSVEFIDEVIGSGAMKDVYFSPDKSYVVAFFRDAIDYNGIDRLEHITNGYKKRIFEQVGGDYWKNLFCWPTDLVRWGDKIGIVCPTYQKQFFFTGSKFTGQEKEGKWFASAKLRNRHFDKSEKGNWLSYFHICIQIARAVRRLHAAGLAHSDLSYKNVLVDPQSGSAVIIDIDGLVVPGKFPPDVVGTPDFIAPEVLETRSLKPGDPDKILPSMDTDKHALAVLIYMYLLYRHPLRGGKVHDLDPTRDEELTMGANALFIEHPTDRSNRPKIDQLSKTELPQGDVTKLPYTICGPYLKELFDRAFIDGLHNPSLRPTAAEWEAALIKTTDLMQPCTNPDCEAQWFVFDNSKHPHCPFCGHPFHGELPVLNFYYSPKKGSFMTEKYRLMVYNKQSLYKWHANRLITPNEKLAPKDRKPVGDFHFKDGRWILINRNLPNMFDADTKQQIKKNQYVELTEDKKILLDTSDGGRLITVQLVSC